MVSTQNTYPMYNIPMMANKTTIKTSVANCAPIPTTAESKTKL